MILEHEGPLLLTRVTNHISEEISAQFRGTSAIQELVGYMQRKLDRGREAVKLFVFDTETGGLDPAAHSLLTIGGVAWDEGEIVGSIELKINEPEIIATPEALAVNKIDVTRLPYDGLRPLEAVRALEGFLASHWSEGPITLAGHNVQFDYGFLKRLYRLSHEQAYEVWSACSAAGEQPELRWATWQQRLDRRFSYRLLDTQTIALFLKLTGIAPQPGGTTKLERLCRYYGVENPEAHTALSDAKATAELLTKMILLVGDRNKGR